MRWAPPCRRRAVLVWGGAALAGAAAAEPVPGEPTPVRTTALAFPGFFRPAAPGLPASGLDVELAAELGRRCGCRLVLEPTNPSRLWPDVRSGATDLTAGAAYLPVRLAEAEYLWLLQSREVVLMHKRQAAATPRRADFDARPALQLGVIRGARRSAGLQAWVDALRAQDRVREAADMQALLRAFHAGRVAAVPLFAAAVNELPSLASEGDWQLQDWFPEERFQAGWAVSKKVPPELRQRLRKAGQSLREDGTLRRLIRRHLGEAALPFYEVLPPP